MERFFSGHMEGTIFFHGVIHYRPYDYELVSVTLGYCPSVEGVEIFPSRFELSCHCLGKCRHTEGFVPSPVHPHFGESYYPHPQD